MPIHTKRWNDPREPDDGHRLLVTRYRPRGVAKADETWDAWDPSLGPTKDLHAAVYTSSASPVPWPIYRKQYIAQQKENADKIAALAKRSQAGETITLLCSSACERESRCHRSILKELIDATG
ncbi:MAG TPA: DUF488 family protein [Tepidisphaeraceae bacterium]|jgi:uncharacterized protein YeaO (DUF488 family)|nr:DUF488 family protein [Tepidisphaeraceae bacterium]